MPEPRPTWSLHRNLSELGKWADERESTVLLAVDEMHAGERRELRRLAGDLQSITGIGELPVPQIADCLLGVSSRTLADTEYRLSASGHVERSADTTVKLTGPLTLSAITAMASSHAGYKPSLSMPAMVPNTADRTRCNAPMPRAKAKCALNRGHKGPHRSRR